MQVNLVFKAIMSARKKGRIMNARQINPFEYANEITQANSKGILFTTQAEGKVNSMVIGWGQIGTLWGKPTFTAFVRTSRESARLADLNPAFTINVPVGGKLCKEVFSLCGTRSGRHHDKITELGLHLAPGRAVDVPAIAEVPLTLECKVVYRHEMDLETMPPEVRERMYPADVTDVEAWGANCYTHIAYFGEIVDAYILEQ